MCTRRHFAPFAVLLLAAAASGADFSARGSMNAIRSGHSSTLLPNGKVLIAGGNPSAGVYLNTAELYDPATGTFTAIGSTMATQRAGHTATLLPSGKVLIAGGYKGGAIGPDNNGVTNTLELFDPATNTFSTVAATMSSGRYGHTATLLANGKVLIAAGFETNYLNTAEVFDPAGGGSLTATNNTLPIGRAYHTATLLANGKVLIAGGYNINGTPTNVDFLYDPSTSTFSTISALMTSIRVHHTATLLPNGKVLIAGGYNNSNDLNSAELFDPSGSGSFSATTTTMTATRSHSSATLLANGKVLIAGSVNTNTGISSGSAELYDPTAGTFTATSSNLTTSRWGQTATLLPAGSVLFAGGVHDGDTINAAEVYDPPAGSFGATNGAMTAIRSRATATLLPNGKVLIAGGLNASPLGSAELFDSSAGTFAATAGAMTAARYFHTATLLGNGKVLIAGGYSSGALNSAELFDPALGTFAATSGTMSAARRAHTATLLPDGKVLIAGGFDGARLDSAEIFDPATGRFQATNGAMVAARYAHTATLLANGKVLLAGGAASTAAELYDPATGTFSATTGVMTALRQEHTATLLPNGKVLIAGGYGSASFVNTAELYDPSTNTFGSTGSLATPRGDAAATLLPTGKVLISGGDTGSGFTSSAELFEPATGTFTTTLTAMSAARSNHTSTLLTTGQVLIGGGSDSTAAQLYDAGLGYSSSRRPVVSSITNPFCQPSTIAVTGTFFTSDSEGSGAGNASAFNSPLLRLQRIDNDQRQFVLSQSTSSAAFTSASLSNLPFGHYRAAIVSNGVPSGEQIIDIETTPLVPSYPETTVAASGSTNISPSSLPGGYNGLYYSLTATATNFTGTFFINGSTGVLTVSNPAPAGDYTVTVASTTNCGSPSTTFTMHVPAAGPPPTNVVATPSSSTSVAITWSSSPGTTYEIVRVAAGGSTTVGTSGTGAFTDSTASANTAYLYKVRTTAPSVSAFSTPDLATTVIFTDASLVSGSTTVKAVHVNELRTAVDAVRALAGLSAGSYSDPSLIAGTTIKRAHVIDLRTALDAARSTLSLAAIAYTRPSIVIGTTTVAAADVDDLRSGVR